METTTTTTITETAAASSSPSLHPTYSVNIIDKSQINKLTELHDQLDRVYHSASTWCDNIDPSDLLIKDANEYQIIQKFRHMNKLMTEMLTKEISEQIANNEHTNFNKRSINKIINNEYNGNHIEPNLSPVPPPKPRHFFGKKTKQ